MVYFFTKHNSTSQGDRCFCSGFEDQNRYSWSGNREVSKYPQSLCKYNSDAPIYSNWNVCGYYASGGGWLRKCEVTEALTSEKLQDMHRIDKEHPECHYGLSPWDQVLVGEETQLRDGPYAASTGGFCEDVNNLNKVVSSDGQTCFGYLQGRLGDAAAKGRAVTYCEANPEQVKTTACSTESLGKEAYERIAAAYCEDADLGGPGDDFCACYNAYKGKCNRTDAREFAGCSGVNQKHNELLSDLPDTLSGGARQQLEERKFCRNNVCTSGTRFKPSGSDACEMNLQVCIPDINIRGNLQDVGINVVCDQDMNDGSQIGGGSRTDDNTGGGGGGSSDSGSKNKGDKTAIGVGAVGSGVCVVIVAVAAATML